MDVHQLLYLSAGSRESSHSVDPPATVAASSENLVVPAFSDACCVTDRVANDTHIHANGNLPSPFDDSSIDVSKQAISEYSSLVLTLQ